MKAIRRWWGPAGALVGYLVFVELSSGVIQGYYTPLLTDVARHLEIHDSDLNWFEAAQLMVSALCVPLLSKLGDLWGHRKILLISTAVTAAACWGVAFAPDFWTFLTAWAVQGFYVVWLPLEIALVYSRSQSQPEPERLTRRAAGVLVAGLEFGVIVAALAGGFLGEIFRGQLWLVLSIPAVCVSACFLVIWRKVPAGWPGPGGVIDWLGFGLVTAALLWMTSGLLLLRLWGVAAVLPWFCLLGGLALLIPFVRHSLRFSEPLLDIRLISSPRMRPLLIATFLLGVSVLGAQVPLSTFARTDPAEVGYGLGVGSGLVSILIGVYVLSLLLGALLYPGISTTLGQRVSLVSSAALVGVGYGLLIPLHAQVWHVLLSLMIARIGSGGLAAALPAAAAASAPVKDAGMATGMTNSLRTIGGSFASCIFGIALASHSAGESSSQTAGSMAGYFTVWIVCSLASFASAIALSRLPQIEQKIAA